MWRNVRSMLPWETSTQKKNKCRAKALFFVVKLLKYSKKGRQELKLIIKKKNKEKKS